MNLKQTLKDHKLWLKSKGEKGKRAYLERTNLKEVNLEGANLKAANLEGANLIEANLEGANLIEANLARANLDRANLKGANLTKANLKGTNLYGANLAEANLARANLERTNLIEVKGKTILTFSVGKHFAWSADGFIKIGCEYRNTVDWLKNYKEIGDENNYTKEQIKLYGQFIKICCNYFKKQV